MATPISIAGAKFTVKSGTTDYSSQIMDGEIAGSANIVDEFVLGPQQVTTATSTSETLTINGLYDGSAGMFKAMWDAYKALTPLSIEVVGDDGKWTGSLHVESCAVPFSAQDSAKVALSLRGPLAYAVAP
jgi:hypothetical protein